MPQNSKKEKSPLDLKAEEINLIALAGHYEFYLYDISDGNAKTIPVKFELIFPDQNFSSTIRILISIPESNLKLCSILNSEISIHDLFSCTDFLQIKNDTYSLENSSTTFTTQLNNLQLFVTGYCSFTILNNNHSIQLLLNNYIKTDIVIIKNSDDEISYIISKTIIDTDKIELSMKNNLLNTAHSKVKNCFESLRVAKNQGALTKSENCIDHQFTKNVCDQQFKYLFPNNYSGKLSEMFEKVCKLHREFDSKPELISQEDELFLNDFSIFLDKIEELRSMNY